MLKDDDKHSSSIATHDNGGTDLCVVLLFYL